MNQGAIYSAEQEQAINNIKYPKGWNSPNPPMLPSPFVYNNSYTNPAYINSYQSGSGEIKPHSNQFNSALTQPLDKSKLIFYQPTPQMRGIGQRGAGIIDHLKKAHNFVKSRKLVSRGLHFASHFRPDLKKYANASEALGYGKKGGSFIADPKIDKYANPKQFKLQPVKNKYL